MNRRRRAGGGTRVPVAVSLALLVGVVAGACGGVGETPVGTRLAVFGAASLRSALQAAAAAYTITEPGTTIDLATDSSATMRTQIEQGAPADVFLAADLRNPEALVEAGLADGGVVAFASTPLAIIVPASNPAAILGPSDLARPGVRIVAAGDGVPISGYATALLDRLAGLDGYPADYASAVAANIVSREDNVAAVAAKVGLGEGDAGIVYATDALAAAGVRAIAIPPEAIVTATYGGVVVATSPRRPAAGAFLGWLAGPAGGAVLADFGFGPPP